MQYDYYITKKRMRVRGACGQQVNLPWGTILPVSGDFILCQNRQLCATTSQNAKDYFWGYDQDHPQSEINRQKAAEALMATAPKDSGDALAKPGNPWNRYGHLREMAGGWIWEWNKTVADLPKCHLEHLLACTRTGTVPQDVQSLLDADNT